MTLDITREFLGWCAVINLAILLWWFFFICMAHNWTYQQHKRFFNISPEQFDTMHYSGIVLFKLSIFFFNIVPYLSLKIIG